MADMSVLQSILREMSILRRILGLRVLIFEACGLVFADSYD